MTGFWISFVGVIASVLAVVGVHHLLVKDREATEAALWPKPNLRLLPGVYDQAKDGAL